MRSFSELSSREKRMEIVRWLCVLPAAVLADFAVSFVVGTIVRSGGLKIRGESSIAYWFVLVLTYGSPKAAFVAAGAKTAPRRPVAIAVVLTVIGFCLSLMTHVVGQHLAGNRVGATNYAHLFAETAGLICGTTCIIYRAGQHRRNTTNTP